MMFGANMQAEKVKDSIIPVGGTTNHLSLMEVCFNSTTQRAHSLIWTNGEVLNYFTFPEQDQELNIKFLRQQHVYNFAIKSDQLEKENFIITRMPLGNNKEKQMNSFCLVAHSHFRAGLYLLI